LLLFIFHGSASPYAYSAAYLLMMILHFFQFQAQHPTNNPLTLNVPYIGFTVEYDTNLLVPVEVKGKGRYIQTSMVVGILGPAVRNGAAMQAPAILSGRHIKVCV